MSDSSLLTNISGIHSKQPFFVLSSEQFLTHLPSENTEVSHFYSFKAGRSYEPTIAIPDGCIDMVFDCDADSPSGQICGTRLEAGSVFFEPGHRYFGVRFVPGFIPDFLTVSAEELIEYEHNIQDVMADSMPLIEQIVESNSFSRKVNIVNAFLKRKKKREPSQLTSQIIRKICLHGGNIQVQDLERFSGYTTRTLQRLFKSDIGLTPKGFSRAIRCQSAVYGINHTDNLIFSDLAIDLGFNDQSHFLREFKKLVNVTPLEYQNRVKEKTYLERIRCY
ncbi:AraC family transcriptional regulator [Vibrio sp. 10N.286.49.C2]|uniref:AraC family transcriptional regulator n=1 Tax=unclassified Vibrio TaxID=2614977 RepID=UPI000C85F51E|nr:MULTISPECIES: AraC family transcriptional regulator [unclassified Vibrio]PMH42931.1 AraC family transcriptional regulator [Vibrio sp. 10N.286.49.C2]PMH53730.1 AraC family transcriptional regulator [Vibrio sp. 10N.286.49.B1]PMH81252.1 AraC family transcriptional regulator [Vibrio sp. 10N.286.48.B7]